MPAVVQELSGERVLCMEWVDGCKVGRGAEGMVGWDCRVGVGNAMLCVWNGWTAARWGG